MERWKVAQGFPVLRTVTIRDGTNAVITSYTGSEPLSGVIWAGDDRSPLATFTPTWLVAPSGTITAAFTPALGPGTYTGEIYPTDKSANFFRFELEILPSAGSAGALYSYITYPHLLSLAPQIGRLQDATADEAQFAPQRNLASLDFDRLVLNRYNPQPGRSRRFLNAAGTGPGPYPVFAPGPAGADAPARATIAGYLGTAALLVNADVLECVARQALAHIYLGQPGTNNPYREAGASERQLAMQCFRRALVEFDTNADGLPEIRVDQDVTWLT